MRKLTLLASAALSCAALTGQSNVIPGLDCSVSEVDNLTSFAREGSYPAGASAVAVLTESCNPGSVPADWYAAMRPNHPPIATMLCREVDGRFEQISDRSFVKHGFLSVNSSGCGFSCIIPPAGGAQLGVGCSDTYGAGLNASRTYLGPADEFDPWLGTWDPVGSYFDRGDPDVGAPGNMDGRNSLNTQGMPAMKNRVRVGDTDLNDPNARFYYQAYYVFAKEAESLRDNNSRHREFDPVWGGSSWTFRNIGDNGQDGTILNRWNGATIGSATNGNDDGRIYVGVNVTGPVNGIYTYNYAMHNRDNHRGIASLRIPTCANATVQNVYIRDIDTDPSNDWTMSRNNQEVSFLAGMDNALRWNMLYTFSFESTAVPLLGDVVVDQARPGAGSSRLTISGIPTPGFEANVDLGAGCGGPNGAPQLEAIGSPAQARIPNPTFGLRVSNLAVLSNVLVNASTRTANLNLGSGCTVFTDPSGLLPLPSGIADFAGRHHVFLPVPNNAALEGARLTFQAVELQSGGAVLGMFDVSNGLLVKIGNNCQ